MFAIIDIETTGGRQTDRITEIAIFVHDGAKIIEEFSTLINPEISIPPFITSLTGISNEMVTDAPKFYEVAKKIIEITTDKTFVAHNVSFDYNFIKKEYQSLGYDYKRKTLCTVKLSRKLIPALNSYSLGEICSELDIKINGRHRAAGDALATVKLFEYLLTINNNENDLFSGLRIESLGNLHPALNRTKIENLPEEAGVYFFYNQRNELIYVGKSNNIYNRVLSHFRNYKSQKSVTMRDSIADIDYVKTGSELIALLYESDEIKRNMPLFNRSQRRTIYTYGLFCEVNNDGYCCLKTDKIKDDNTLPITVFHSLENAKSCVEGLINTFGLCQKYCGLYETSTVCFNYSIKKCNGACNGYEDAETYNLRVKQALSQFEFTDKNFFIIDKGRHAGERAVIKVENGKYMGYGYIDKGFSYSSHEELSSCVKRYADNKDVQQIIRSYLKRKKVEQILKF